MGSRIIIPIEEKQSARKPHEIYTSIFKRIKLHSGLVWAEILKKVTVPYMPEKVKKLKKTDEIAKLEKSLEEDVQAMLRCSTATSDLLETTGSNLLEISKKGESSEIKGSSLAYQTMELALNHAIAILEKRTSMSPPSVSAWLELREAYSYKGYNFNPHKDGRYHMRSIGCDVQAGMLDTTVSNTMLTKKGILESMLFLVRHYERVKESKLDALFWQALNPDTDMSKLLRRKRFDFRIFSAPSVEDTRSTLGELMVMFNTRVINGLVTQPDSIIMKAILQDKEQARQLENRYPKIYNLIKPSSVVTTSFFPPIGGKPDRASLPPAPPPSLTSIGKGREGLQSFRYDANLIQSFS